MTVYPPVRSTTARISATPTCPHRNRAVKRAALALATSAAPRLVERAGEDVEDMPNLGVGRAVVSQSSAGHRSRGGRGRVAGILRRRYGETWGDMGRHGEMWRAFEARCATPA